MDNIRLLSCVFLITSCFGCHFQSKDMNQISFKQKKEKEIACKLTSSELQHRKEMVLASLKKQVLEKQELPNGYQFRFETRDSLIDELASFIKSERLCCDFFSFSLLISGDDPFTWLSITGPQGAREFIRNEMGL